MSGISFSSSAAAPSDASANTSSLANSHAAFADAMAGASRPTAPARPKAARDDDRDQDKPGKDKGDHDESDTSAVQADPSGAAPAQPVAAAASAVPVKDASNGKAAPAKSEGAACVSTDKAAQVADATAGPVAVADQIDPTLVAPVLAALADAAAAGKGNKALEPALTNNLTVAPQPTPQAEAAAPLPTTAAMMAARTIAAAEQPKEPRAAPATRKGRDAAAAGKTAGIDTLAAAAPAPAAETPQPDASATIIPAATQQLADGSADRQLDLAKQGAWLDGLSRDIAATGDVSGTFRFQVAPQHLGLVQVELARGVEGAAVTLTASSESARVALADARPQLVAEARVQGLHIANAQVDVSADARRQGNAHAEQRHDPRGQPGFGAQMGSGSTNNGSQTRSQPIAVNQNAEGRADAPAGEAEPVSSAGPADGMYA